MTISGAEAVERLVLDTSVYAAMCRGHEEVLDWVASSSAVVTSVIVLGELEAGFEMGNRARVFPGCSLVNDHVRPIAAHGP